MGSLLMGFPLRYLEQFSKYTSVHLISVLKMDFERFLTIVSLEKKTLRIRLK